MHLRHSVLWPDKPVSYVLLPEDDAGLHFGAFVPSGEPLNTTAPVAVISLFEEALPGNDSRSSPIESTTLGDKPRAARFRKFACDPAFQGQGIGTALLRHAFHHAHTRLGCAVIWCDAMVETAGWYERRGMQRFGDIFYKGHIEYVRMKIEL